MKVSKDDLAFMQILKEKAEAGDVTAMDRYATFYSQDHPELLDETTLPTVLSYFEQAVAAGIPRAALNLGALYYNGVFVPQDFKKAIELYTIAAESDETDIASIASSNLGYCYYYGRDVEVNYERAFKYFFKSAVFYNDPVALYKLGDMYLNGLFVEQDNKMAYKLYLEAEACANVQDHYAYPDIAKRLAKYMLDPHDSKAFDPYTALEYLTRAQSILYNKVYKRRDPFAGEVLASVETLIEDAKQWCKELY